MENIHLIIKDKDTISYIEQDCEKLKNRIEKIKSRLIKEMF